MKRVSIYMAKLHQSLHSGERRINEAPDFGCPVSEVSSPLYICVVVRVLRRGSGVALFRRTAAHSMCVVVRIPP